MELLLLLLPPLLLPWFGAEKRAGRTVGRASGAAGFTFGGNGARKLSKACNVLGIPSASERGTKSEVAYNWARWLHNPYHLGGPLHFRVGGTIRSGPLVGKVATLYPS